SSRRRHTRFSRDWSSDVCSSDLVFTELLNISDAQLEQIGQTSRMYHQYLERLYMPGGMARQAYVNQLDGEGGNELSMALRRLKRSEERRGGKECGWRTTGGRERG